MQMPRFRLGEVIECVYCPVQVLQPTGTWHWTILWSISQIRGDIWVRGLRSRRAKIDGAANWGNRRRQRRRPPPLKLLERSPVEQEPSLSVPSSQDKWPNTKAPDWEELFVIFDPSPLFSTLLIKGLFLLKDYGLCVPDFIQKSCLHVPRVATIHPVNLYFCRLCLRELFRIHSVVMLNTGWPEETWKRLKK